MILNRKIFDDGISEIGEAFNDFGMTLKRADIWYKHSKTLDDSKWQKKIADCIKGCRKIPTLADILDIKGYYHNDPGRPSEIPYEQEEVSHGKMPDDFKNSELRKKIKRMTG